MALKITRFPVLWRICVFFMTQPVSLTRYLIEQQRIHGHIPAELRLLLEVVARACKSISRAVNQGSLGGVLGTAESSNVQGEVQK